MKINNFKKILPTIAGLGFLSNATSAFADVEVNLTNLGLGVPTNTLIGPVIGNIVKIIFYIALLAVLFMLIVGAFQWIISGGDKEKVASARGRITHALIGMAILALAFLIVTLVGKLVGIPDPLNFTLPSLLPAS